MTQNRGCEKVNQTAAGRLSRSSGTSLTDFSPLRDGAEVFPRSYL